MSTTNASMANVLKVTAMPSVVKEIWAKSTFEKKAIKKKKVIAKIPAPTGGDGKSGTWRFALSGREAGLCGGSEGKVGL